ncbi:MULTISPECIES: DUF2127 domain-containing protein [unclassified Pseudonocardia]|uniref:DUF2127 domain-containing protein n=1 Tax=unclassified Pseudonocardia TaxID=2619320 RepID=UPI0001FFEEEA|nr:DUF2127 domain-containing protein [Pseudonocardia sp. Ae707_Ps1]OLM17008.1 putative membrane protein [Pseudonocardia sp. Ae707_Ps1]
MTRPAAEQARWTERLFRIALVVKGVDGAAELLAAVALLLVSGDWLHHVVARILARDLVGPLDGTLARHLVAGTDAFAGGDRTFAVVYLALHGAIKLALVGALLRKWLPAYPPAIVVLSLFVVYELVHAWHTGSLLLPFLAALDVAIIVLVLREYRLLSRERRE